MSETMQMGIRERRAEASETVWNFAVVGRGTERLFTALKIYLESKGGKVKYQRLSGYEFRVQEVLPEILLESESSAKPRSARKKSGELPA